MIAAQSQFAPPIRVYRVLRKSYARAPFDGEGAFLYGGRWSSPGIRLCYTSEHQSLAMLEYFVHIEAEEAPLDLVLAVAEVPVDLLADRIAASSLPIHWRRSPSPAEIAAIGNKFVQRAKYGVLIVPSALSPNENNWLLNPQHPDFSRITVLAIEPLTYDPRMFAPQRRKRRQSR